ncbi:uncharacterized protein LOC100114621 isoform X1 [Nasonia vitripennis]|uniref:Uncharacterized protein n=1 Tax=Nasonia vitripennis TaxID=7425 RepID=A0A7M7PUI9_NASVI|nr:uncharacterized protein LOC100114621 isoform X1 [Nasonia vitripennis]
MRPRALNTAAVANFGKSIMWQKYITDVKSINKDHIENEQTRTPSRGIHATTTLQRWGASTCRSPKRRRHARPTARTRPPDYDLSLLRGDNHHQHRDQSVHEDSPDGPSALPLRLLAMCALRLLL